MRVRMAARSAARSTLLLSFALALIACAPVDDEELPVLEEATQALAAGAVTTLVQGIGDAENATFSPDGRLFVTGGENAYEITRVGSGYAATKLYAGTCNFTGIVVRSGTLFASRKAFGAACGSSIERDQGGCVAGKCGLASAAASCRADKDCASMLCSAYGTCLREPRASGEKRSERNLQAGKIRAAQRGRAIEALA